MSDEVTEDPLIDFLSTFAQDAIFPGRARLFCDQRLVGSLPADQRKRCEWSGASGGLLVGAAVGAAAAEGPRGGSVVVVVPASACAEPLMLAAGSMAVRLQLASLTLAVIGSDPAVMAPLLALGFAARGPGPVVRLFAPLEAASLPPAADVRREWQPVHMRTLLPGTLPPWPLDAASLPTAAASDWLAWLAIREPDLVVVNLAAGWREQIPGPALVCALAQLAAEGRRVCWRLPSGTDLRPWLDALQQVGRRGLALKLLINANDLPPRANLATLNGWWVMVPADTLEAAAMFAHALDHEDPVLMGLIPSLPVVLPAWPPRQAYHPGRGRWLNVGAAATLACDQRTVAVAAAAAAALAQEGVLVGVLLCTSVLPLPVGDLDRAGPGPLVACGSDLGIALASAMTDRDVLVDIATDVSSPALLVAAVHRLIRR